MFTYKYVVKLHDTDAAGLLFFSNQFKMMHDAYESFLSSIGFGFLDLLKKKDFFLPIVHAESNYKKALFAGDVLTIQVKVLNIGRTSFSLDYKLFDSKKILVGSGRTVHVAVRKKAHRKIPIPPKFRAALVKAS